MIGNPIVVDAFPFSAEKEPFLLWIGRLNDDKGPQRAIAAARRAGRSLVLASPVQPGEKEFFVREVEPHLDEDGVRYIGEVGRRTSTSTPAPPPCSCRSVGPSRSALS